MRSKVVTAALASLAGAALVAAAPAAAEEAPPPDPAIAQYVETVPTSKGPRVRTGQKKRTTKPPAAVRKAVREQGGSDAKALEDVVSSSDLGAPQPAPKPARKVRPKPAKPKPEPKRPPTAAAPRREIERSAPAAASAPAAVVQPEDTSGRRPVVWLGGLLALLTAGAVAYAAARRRLGRL